MIVDSRFPMLCLVSIQLDDSDEVILKYII